MSKLIVVKGYNNLETAWIVLRLQAVTVICGWRSQYLITHSRRLFYGRSFRRIHIWSLLQEDSFKVAPSGGFTYGSSFGRIQLTLLHQEDSFKVAPSGGFILGRSFRRICLVLESYFYRRTNWSCFIRKTSFTWNSLCHGGRRSSGSGRSTALQHNRNHGNTKAK